MRDLPGIRFRLWIQSAGLYFRYAGGSSEEASLFQCHHIACVKDLPAQRVDHRIIGEDAVNGIAENEDQQCQQLGGRQSDADGGPDNLIYE